MRKLWTTCTFAVSLFAFNALAGEWTGYITDAKCKHADGSEKSVKCVEACVRGGAAPMFLNSADNQVYKIANADKVEGHYGRKVIVTGNMENETLTIDSLKAAEGK